ncbi:hypothetical protein DFH08DRAFT_954686 [Mycena albidolilacea]|uniref:Ribonuclease H1 N-terminal domain-containing protein n=1 Tax=Mycena albidolilacea TaxID=1033008 RepID=A0AAD7ACG1_9AGAR|nr:hypothetical protein DFH08DRAFT_954686 [Mycena albidolilacea]
MHTPLATNTISSRAELMAAIATVDELVVRAVRLTRTAQILKNTAEDVARTAQDLQVRLPVLLDHQNEREAEDHIWVRATAKSPTQVAADHANASEGQRPWYVVYVGREPGLYDTVEQADTQIKGCPGQQYRRKASKREAIDFYRAKFEANEVEKWVEMQDE